MNDNTSEAAVESKVTPELNTKPLEDKVDDKLVTIVKKGRLSIEIREESGGKRLDKQGRRSVRYYFNHPTQKNSKGIRDDIYCQFHFVFPYGSG